MLGGSSPLDNRSGTSRRPSLNTAGPASVNNSNGGGGGTLAVPGSSSKSPLTRVPSSMALFASGAMPLPMPAPPANGVEVVRGDLDTDADGNIFVVSHSFVAPNAEPDAVAPMMMAASLNLQSPLRNAGGSNLTVPTRKAGGTSRRGSATASTVVDPAGLMLLPMPIMEEAVEVTAIPPSPSNTSSSGNATDADENDGGDPQRTKKNSKERSQSNERSADGDDDGGGGDGPFAESGGLARRQRRQQKQQQRVAEFITQLESTEAFLSTSAASGGTLWCASRASQCDLMNVHHNRERRRSSFDGIVDTTGANDGLDGRTRAAPPTTAVVKSVSVYARAREIVAGELALAKRSSDEEEAAAAALEAQRRILCKDEIYSVPISYRRAREAQLIDRADDTETESDGGDGNNDGDDDGDDAVSNATSGAESEGRTANQPRPRYFKRDERDKLVHVQPQRRIHLHHKQPEGPMKRLGHNVYSVGLSAVHEAGAVLLTAGPLATAASPSSPFSPAGKQTAMLSPSPPRKIREKITQTEVRSVWARTVFRAATPPKIVEVDMSDPKAAAAAAAASLRRSPPSGSPKAPPPNPVATAAAASVSAPTKKGRSAGAPSAPPGSAAAAAAASVSSPSRVQMGTRFSIAPPAKRGKKNGGGDKMELSAMMAASSSSIASPKARKESSKKRRTRALLGQPQQRNLAIEYIDGLGVIVRQLPPEEKPQLIELPAEDTAPIGGPSPSALRSAPGAGAPATSSPVTPTARNGGGDVTIASGEEHRTTPAKEKPFGESPSAAQHGGNGNGSSSTKRKHKPFELPAVARPFELEERVIPSYYGGLRSISAAKAAHGGDGDGNGDNGNGAPFGSGREENFSLLDVRQDSMRGEMMMAVSERKRSMQGPRTKSGSASSSSPAHHDKSPRPSGSDADDAAAPGLLLPPVVSVARTQRVSMSAQDFAGATAASPNNANAPSFSPHMLPPMIAPKGDAQQKQQQQRSFDGNSLFTQIHGDSSGSVSKSHRPPASRSGRSSKRGSLVLMQSTNLKKSAIASARQARADAEEAERQKQEQKRQEMRRLFPDWPQEATASSASSRDKKKAKR